MEQKLCPGCEEPVIDKLPGCPLQCRTVQCKAYQKKPIYDYELMPIIWVIGGPGSGKLTQCQKIVATYGLTYLSPGQMIRQEIASGSDRARCLHSVTGRGGLVPNDLVLGLLKEAIEKAAAKGARGFVINGFPREKSQGPQFERTIGPCSLIIYLSASVRTMFNRMSHRPKNPHRIDETPIAMKLRLETYMSHYEHVIELYKYRLVKIDTEKPADAAFAEIIISIDKVMADAAAAREAKASEQAATNEQQPSSPAAPKDAKTNEQVGTTEKQSSKTSGSKDSKTSEQVATTKKQSSSTTAPKDVKSKEQVAPTAQKSSTPTGSKKSSQTETNK